MPAITKVMEATHDEELPIPSLNPILCTEDGLVLISMLGTWSFSSMASGQAERSGRVV